VGDAARTALRVGVWAFTLVVLAYTVVVVAALVRGGVADVRTTAGSVLALVVVAGFAHALRRRVDRRPRP
jgi:hypothetical protein